MEQGQSSSSFVNLDAQVVVGQNPTLRIRCPLAHCTLLHKCPLCRLVQRLQLFSDTLMMKPTMMKPSSLITMTAIMGFVMTIFVVLKKPMIPIATIFIVASIMIMLNIKADIVVVPVTTDGATGVPGACTELALLGRETALSL